MEIEAFEGDGQNLELGLEPYQEPTKLEKQWTAIHQSPNPTQTFVCQLHASWNLLPCEGQLVVKHMAAIVIVVTKGHIIVARSANRLHTAFLVRFPTDHQHFCVFQIKSQLVYQAEFRHWFRPPQPPWSGKQMHVLSAPNVQLCQVAGKEESSLDVWVRLSIIFYFLNPFEATASNPGVSMW